MTNETSELFARRGIPKLRDPITGSRREVSPIGVEGKTVDLATVGQPRLKRLERDRQPAG